MESIAKRKWTLMTVVLIAGGVGTMALLGHKVVHTELVISAPPSLVWSVLTDASKYADWNPVIVQVDGEYRDGAELMNRVREPSGKESVMKSKVVKMTSERELNQFGGVRGILTFDHQWLLEPIADGTKVVQHEEYRGVGVWFWDASWVEPAYQQALEALQAHVTQLNGEVME